MNDQEFQAWLGTKDFTPDSSAAGRLGHGAALAVPRMLEGINRSADVLLGNDIEQVISPEAQLSPGETIPQKGADLISALLPAIGQMILTGGPVATIAKTAGLAPLATRVATDATALGGLGLAEDQLTGAEQTIEGGAFGALAALPRLARIPLAAGLGFTSKAFFDRNGAQPVVGDWSRGDVSGIAGALGSLLPSQITRPVRKVLTDHFTPTEPTTPTEPIPFNPASSTFDPEAPLRLAPDTLPPTSTQFQVQTQAIPEGGITPPRGLSVTGLQFADTASPIQPSALSPEEAAIAATRPDIDTLGLRLVQQPKNTFATDANLIPESNIINPLAPVAESSITPPSEILAPGQIEPQSVVLSTVPASTILPVEQISNVRSAKRQSMMRKVLQPLQNIKGTKEPTGPTAITEIVSDPSKIKIDNTNPFADVKSSDVLPENLGFKVAKYGTNEWGGVSPEMMQLMGLASARAAVGGTLGATVGARDESSATDPLWTGMAGALIGLVGPSNVASVLIGAAQKAKRAVGPSSHYTAGEAGSIPVNPNEPNIATIAKNNGVRYDGEWDMLGMKAHQFTVDDPSSPLYRASFYLEGSVDDAALKSKILAKTAEFQTPKSQVLDSEGTASSIRARQSSSEGGFIMPELSAAMSRAGIGSLIGGVVGGLTDDKGDHTGFILGAMAGAAAGSMGPSAARSLVEALGKMKTIPPPSGQAGKGIAQRAADLGNLAKNFRQVLVDKSGAAFRGSEKVSDRVVRYLDSRLGLLLSSEVKRSLAESKGAASVLLDRIDSSILKLSLRFNPDEAVKTVANQFLDGKLSRDQFLQQLQNAAKLNPEIETYAKFVVTARESVDGLQRMISEGVGDPKLRKIINESIGQYLTRTYKVFTDPKWKPNVESIEKLVDELHTKNVFKGSTREDIRTILDQYVREVKATKSFYKVSGSPTGEAINQRVFKERKELSSAWREFLGEITDPTERIYQTVFRLRPMAEASKYFSSLSKVQVDGIPQVFNAGERDAFRNQLLQRLQSMSKDSPEAVKINQQLKELAGYQPVENLPKYGDLKGKLVSQHVWDTLATFDSITDVIDHPLLRSIAGAHTMIKLGRTVLNPLTTVRNYLTSPMFMALARVTNPNDITEAWNVMRNIDHPLHKEVISQGISGVDQIRTEFFKEFESITGGKYNFGSIDMSNLGMGKLDLDLAEKVSRRGFRKLLDFYRVPDNVVRIASYISAKRRISQKLGLDINHPDVVSKATDFTNRYTMNYDTIAPIFKAARQLPFTNLFLSYTVEMARIGKNLMEDLVRGGDGITSHSRMYAAAPFAMLAVIPEMWQAASEAELSPKDKADWDKAKALMPEYSRTRYRMGIHRDPKTKQFHYYDFTPLLAGDSFNQMTRAILKGDWEALASVNPVVGWDNTPLANILISQATGKDLHTRREFRSESQVSDRFASIAKEILPPWVPSVGSEALRFQQAYSQNEAGLSGITNLKTGQRLTPADVWLPYFSGVKSGSTSLSVLQKRRQQEAKNEVANEVAYLNDVLKSDLPLDKKAKAADKTRLALAAIREKYVRDIGEVSSESETSVSRNGVALSNQSRARSKNSGALQGML